MNSTGRSLTRKYISEGIDQIEQWSNRVASIKEAQVAEVEDYANSRLINVGRGSFQVWIRRDREICFRAMRAAQRNFD
jgi:hypothetical protein